jgi:glucose-1-phosphate thymidylyltransferase
MMVLILAAGRGKRMRPLTDHIAKSLLPVGGRPVIERILHEVSESRISNQVIIIVGWLGNQIRNYLGNEKFGVSITYLEQKEQYGMAHAIRIAENFLNEDFLVLAGDSIYPSSHLKELMDFHRTEKCDATLSLKEISSEEALKLSTVEIGMGNKILKIVEKPSVIPKGRIIASSPVYIFKPMIFDYIRRIAPSDRGEYEIQDAIQLLIDEGKNVRGIFCRNWIHLTDHLDLLKLNFDYLNSFLKQRE